jgi:hypothetical protein
MIEAISSLISTINDNSLLIGIIVMVKKFFDSFLSTFGKGLAEILIEFIKKML